MTRTQPSVATGFRSVLAESDRRRVVWLDSTGYARRLFAPDEDVWAETGRYVELVRQAQQLLGSEVIEVRLDAFHRAALATDPSLAEALRGRRIATVLRRLLESTSPTDRALEVADALGVLYPATPIVLVLGGGGQWLAWAASLTGQSDIEIDDVDSAAVYAADAMRGFGASAVSGLALDLRGSAPMPLTEVVELHAPVINLAGDYGWPVTVIADDPNGATALAGGALEAILCPAVGFGSLPIAASPLRIGGGLDRAFWSGPATPAPPAGVLAYGEIPPDAQPETVLTKLAEFRQQ